jgi:hypothetical protein
MATPTNSFPIEYRPLNLTLISDSNGASFYEAVPNATKVLIGSSDAGVPFVKQYKLPPGSEKFINNPGVEFTMTLPGGLNLLNNYPINKFIILAKYYIDYSTGTPVNRTYFEVTETTTNVTNNTTVVKLLGNYYSDNVTLNFKSSNPPTSTTTTTTTVANPTTTTTTIALDTTSTTTLAPTTSTSTTTTTTSAAPVYYYYKMLHCTNGSGYIVGPYLTAAYKLGDILIDSTNTNYYTVIEQLNNVTNTAGYSITNQISNFTKSNLTSCPTPTNTGGTTGGGTTGGTTPIDQIVGYELSFASNFSSDADLSSNTLKLNSDVNGLGNISLLLGQNTDGLQSVQSKLTGGTITFSITGALPSSGLFTYDKIYWAKKSLISAGANISNYTDISSIISTDKKSITKSFQAPSDVAINDGIGVVIFLKKQVVAIKPTLTVPSTATLNIPDSQATSEHIITVPVTTTNAQSVKVYIGTGATPKYLIPVDSGGNATIAISFLNDFGGIAGTKTVVVVPFSATYGDGDQSAVTIKLVAVNDFPSITTISYTSNIDIPTYSDTKVPYKITYTAFQTKYVNIELILNGKAYPIQSQYASTTYQILLSDLEASYPDIKTSSQLTVRVTPYNISTTTINGNSLVTGNSVTLVTQVLRKPIVLTKDDVSKLLTDALRINTGNIAPIENKYLTHLASFDGTDRLLISNWINDNWTLSEKITNSAGNSVVTKEIKSIIIKLYGKLPDNIVENQTLWVTKIAANPLVETVVLQEDIIESCKQIAGPNTAVDAGFVEGPTNYETIESLKLTSEYQNPPIINTDDLNIKYYG